MQEKQKSATLTPKAYEIAATINSKRKAKGMASSISAVISEAIVSQYGNQIEQDQ